MNEDELASMLDAHKKWLRDEPGGRHANLRGADLRHADLRHADLRGADLSYADLSHADLSHADLRHADLRHADLSYADLRGADLSHADLRHADLRYADLSGAQGAGLAVARTVICPDGAIIGWKKAVIGEGTCIVKLLVPGDAKRSNAGGRKCRCSKACVLDVQSIEGESIDGAARSNHDDSFVYEVGKTVFPTKPFDDDRWNECASGIHFYITRKEAVAH